MEQGLQMGEMVIRHSILLSCSDQRAPPTIISKISVPWGLLYFLEKNCSHLRVICRVEMKISVSFNGCIELSFSCIPKIVVLLVKSAQRSLHR